MIHKLSHRLATVAVAAAASMIAVTAHAEIDNSALSSPSFRPHVRTFGLVYTLPKEVNDTLDLTTRGMLREKLLNAKLDDEAQRFNIPHVTVVHIHNADATTPEKMLKALPKLPGELKLVLKNFYTTEAAKGAGHPWWLDLGIVKEGPGFEAMMAFNTAAVPALAALRDGPLPRVTGHGCHVELHLHRGARGHAKSQVELVLPLRPPLRHNVQSDHRLSRPPICRCWSLQRSPARLRLH